MGNQEAKLQIIVDAQDKTTAAFKGISASLEDVSRSMRTIGIAGTAAFGGLSAALAFSTKEAIDAESATNRLTQLLKTSRKATDDQIAVLLEQAKALQKVGVVSEQNVLATQSQLATFDLEVNSIKRLTPAILNYVVAEKGAAATTEDYKQLTNGLALALQGNFTSLTRTGFVLDDATKNMIANGNEVDRTTALVKVLDSTYAGFNATARNTAEGSLQAVKNQLSDIGQTIGEAFLPAVKNMLIAIQPTLEAIARWVEANPKLTQTILTVALVLSGLFAVLLPISLALPGLIALFTALGAAFVFVAGLSAPLVLAIGGISAALALLVANGYTTKEAWQNVWLGIKVIAADAANSVVGVVEAMINFVIGGVNMAVSAINKVISAAQKVPGVGKFIPKIGEISPVSLGKIDTGVIAANDLAGRSNPVPAPQQNVVVTGNTVLSESVAEQIGDLIMKKFKLSSAF